MTYVCAECGKPDLHITAWIFMNSSKLVDCDAPNDAIWCPHCDEEVDARALSEAEETAIKDVVEK